MNRISIIIPTYQHAESLPACLTSVFGQTRVPDEVIVVDDGSTDETVERIKSWRDRVVFIQQPHAGAPTARMNGFRHSTGNLVLFCDADVRLHPFALHELEGALRTHPDASYAYAGFRWGHKRFPSFPFDSKRLRQENYIHTTALIRREHFPGFDPSLRRFQDWDLWLTMLQQGHIGVHVPRELFVVGQQKGRVGMSRWLPRSAHRFPWRLVGWKPSALHDYEEARQVILDKHRLHV